MKFYKKTFSLCLCLLSLCLSTFAMDIRYQILILKEEVDPLLGSTRDLKPPSPSAEG